MAGYNKLEKLVSQHKNNAVLKKTFVTLACLVVFITTYMLILPALTLETELICKKEEHTHSSSCYGSNKTLICGQEEYDGHKHSSECYTTNVDLVCGKEESEDHKHDDSCYKETKELTCKTEESEGHHHSDSCYKEETFLKCDKAEHTHGDSCYKVKEEATTEKKEEKKAKTSEATTEKAAEATTEKKVEGDPKADVETASVWEKSVSGAKLNGDWAHDLLAIANTQIGYKESSKNYVKVGDKKKGYTRYGAWYGDPYGDWCAMFASFCLHYAGIGTDYFPEHSECTAWIHSIKKYKLYHEASSDYEPKAGDIIFFHKGKADKLSNHVGIVSKVDAKNKVVYTIEGNHGNCVSKDEYSMSDDRIVGYGELPENPALKKEEKKETYPAQSFKKKANGISVNVTAEEGAFPEGTTMKVTAVTDKKVLNKAIKKAEAENAKAKAVDITFYNSKNKEIEPAKPIRVTMKASELSETEDVTVVHIDDSNKASVVKQTPDKKLSKKEKPEADEVVFDSDEFSTYAIVYTVDFSYGEYEFSIEGESSILLSELLKKLHINKEDGKELTVSDVKEVTFTDKTLVQITMKDNDWVLQSLKAFKSKEELELTLTDSTVLKIKVTDSQTVTDIGGSVTDVTISGATKTDSGYTVKAGDPYSINIKFKETTDTQFSMDNSLTYQLPNGVKILEPQSGTGTLTVEGGTVQYTYTIDTNGRVTIQWPTDHSGDAWKKATESQYMELELDVKGVFESNGQPIQFKAGTEGTVNVDQTHNLKVEKSGSYNAQTNRVDYTVKVTSTGHNTNINVNDVISGSALTYNASTFKAEPNKGTVSNNGNGFTYHMDSMNNNETVTITYSADVNLNGITKGADGNYNGTFDQTGNTVKVTGNDTPGDTDKTEGKDFSNKISYSNLSKSSGGTADTSNPNVKQLTWTIKANENANVSMAGKTIKDTISEDSRSVMKYSGKGIKVIVRDKSGNTVETREVSWSQLGVNPSNATGWTYSVPQDDQNYSYEIVYTTDVTAHETNDTVVHNGAEDGNGNHSDGSATIGPTAGPTTIKKEYTSIDTVNDEITWKITLGIPSVGYNTYSVKDFYPNTHDSALNKTVYFTYKENSINVTGLVGQENYRLDTSNEQYLLITFYKDQNNQGLGRTDAPREITITLTTKMSDTFVNYAKNSTNVNWVQNKATAYTPDKEITATSDAGVRYTDKSLKKYNSGISTNYVNGKPFPMIRYDIEVTGITNESFDSNGNLVLTDTYDGEYLTWLPVKDQNGNDPDAEKNYNGYVYGAIINNNWRYPQQGKSSFKVINNSAGQLTITLNKDTLPKNSGEFYEVYTIPYYLTFKNSDALEKLESEAAKNYAGTYTLKNKVDSPGYNSVEDKYDYSTDILKKSATKATLDGNTGNYIVDYTLQLNPKAEKLGDTNSLQLVDESKNLSIDLTSIVATPSLGVSWNRDSDNKLVFTIPNETAVTITYKAKVVGSGNVNYSNKATLYGQDKTSGDSVDMSSSSHGSAVTYKMNILKYEEGDVMTKLEGVEFDLYMLESTSEAGNHPASDGKDSKPSENDSRWVPINDKDKPFVTDSEGHIKIDADTLKSHDSKDTHEGNALDRQCWYMLKEHAAPTVNGVQYELDRTPHMFWIDPNADADYSKSVYANDDTITISNKPKDNTKIGFTIKKLWQGADASQLPDQITIHLRQKNSIYDSNDTATDVKQITLKKSDFNGSLEWTGEFKDLEKGKAYFIVEDPVDGYKTTYEDENTIGYTRNGTISLTNSTDTEFKVSKKWVESDGTTELTDEANLPDSIQIKLLQDGKQYGDTYTIEKSKNWELTIPNLPAGSKYTVEEIVPEGYEQLSLTYGDDGKSAVVTNRKPSDTPIEGATEVKVHKKWMDIDGRTELPANMIQNLSAEIQLVRYKTEQQKADGTKLVFFAKDYQQGYGTYYDTKIVKHNSKVTILFDFKDYDLDMYATTTDITTGTYGKDAIVGFANKLNKVQHWNEKYVEYNLDVGNEDTIYLFVDPYNANQLIKRNDTIAPEYLAGVTSGGDPVLDTGFSRTVTLSNANSWNATFANLPSTETVGDKIYSYSYAVKEISCSDGFEWKSYSSGTAERNDSTNTPISNPSGDITVTNKKKEAYELPDTGGMGTTPFTISGLALIGLAGGILINKNRRKEDI